VSGLLPEVQTYYDCLMRPFKDKVLSAIEKLRGRPIDLICPSHGPVLRKDPLETVAQYERWSRQGAPSSAATPTRVVILYLSPHGNTARMAEAVAAGAGLPGVEVVREALDALPEGALRDLLESADALAFGVPTVNRDAPRPLWDVFASLSAVKLKTSVAGVFGSYGWSGEACKMAEERLRGLRLQLPVPAVRSAFTPSAEDLERCRGLGRALVEGALAGKVRPTVDPAAA
jgi:NADH oxidase (H2O-forming)